MKLSRPSAFSRGCAALAVAMLLLPPPAHAATITNSSLAEIPLQGSNPVKPNIMYTMDDSGSMNLPMLPDYVYQTDSIPEPTYTLNNDGTVRPALNFDTSLNWTSWCLGSGGAAATCALSSPPFASSAFNKIYYDPSIDYIVGKRSDGTNLLCEATDSPDNPCEGPWTAVYKDGFAGYPGANNGVTTNLVTGFPDELFCANNAPTAADLATARTDGSACRYNGITYGGSAGYRYPNASFPFPYPGAVFCSTSTPTAADLATAATSGSVCRYRGATYATYPPGDNHVYPNALFPYPGTRLTGNPFYYTISSVQFCATHDANGWGTGTCTARWSPTDRYVSYGAGGFDPTAFARVDIKPFAGTNAFGRTYAQEMSNFAKWYAFARTRLLAMKTAGGIAFSALALGQNTRVGFNTLNSFATRFLNVQDFKEPYASTWFTNFYSATAARATPSLDAMWRVGEYFSNRGGAAGLIGAVDPLDSATGQCQLNYHLLSTDGYWFQQDPVPGFSDRIGNRDLNVPGTLPGPIEGFTPGAQFPHPYREGSGVASSIMSDYAMYYWINDIRTDKADKVKDSVAPWQHVTFYGLSIGAEGTLIPGVDDQALLDGTKEWPKPVIAGNVNAGPAGIDDLWHAAVNSRGRYINAQNAQQLAEGMVSALSDFTDQVGTAAAVGLSGAQLTSSTSFGYKTTYEAGWWGDVKKYALDPLTGALPVDAKGNPLKAPVWSAATQVDAQVAGNGWHTNRRIVTMNGSNPVAFRKGEISDQQLNSLNAGWSAPKPSAEAVLNFLRGDKSNEGVGAAHFRQRAHILGDFVTSGAVPVGAPRQPYDDAGNPGYTAFATANKLRTPTVYVGGNDGMLHAFNNSPCLSAEKCLPTEDAGKETWAYIPQALFTAGDPNDTSHKPSPEFQLGALSYRRGGIPLFKHHFYVNATPRVWDIDLANTNTSTPPTTDNKWRTVLVGGLGAGGQAVYALDVTTPVALTDSEATVAASGRVLWEVSSGDKPYENLGYVFDAPTLVKTQRFGWVALVASGYNNKDGKGRLFVINPTDGKLLKSLSTDVGDKDHPSGLSTIRAYTASRKDPYVLQAYGGDLLGNVWRFDLSDPDAGKWKVELIAKLTDANGKAQPITTGVRVEIDQNNNVDRYLFVGTGKLLDQGDLSDKSVTNTLYVIKDGTRTTPEKAPKIPYSRADLNSVDGTAVSGFSGPATGRGWYQDATDSTQKIVTDVIADVQTVVAVFSKPADDPCDAALKSSLYARDFVTGNSVLQSAGGAVVAGIYDIGAIAGASLIQGQSAGGGLSGDVRIQVTTMKGQVFSFGVNLTGGSSLRHRVSWRLINRN